MNEGKAFHVTKVYSRNIITDWIQGIRNMLGMELKAYANIIENGIHQAMKETPKDKKWFKIDVETTSTNAFIIIIYGESK